MSISLEHHYLLPYDLAINNKWTESGMREIRGKGGGCDIPLTLTHLTIISSIPIPSMMIGVRVDMVSMQHYATIDSDGT